MLRPGGTLWVDALNADCLPTALSEARRRRHGRPQHLRYDRVSDFEAALHASGFGAVQLHWVPVMPERLRFLQPVAESAPFATCCCGCLRSARGRATPSWRSPRRARKRRLRDEPARFPAAVRRLGRSPREARARAWRS